MNKSFNATTLRVTPAQALL